jgi:hypothetical protein
MNEARPPSWHLGGFCAAAAVAGFLSACGGHGSAPPATLMAPTQNPASAVTMVATATANDQLYGFRIHLTHLALTSQYGKTVDVITKSLGVEFMHLNGSAEPLATVSIPQDTYVSASATVDYATFSCADLNPYGAVGTSTFENDSPSVTVNVPAPLVVAGPMGLVLDLQVSKSASFGSCAAEAVEAWSVQPTFNIRAFTLGESGSSLTVETNLDGLVSSLGASKLTVTAADGPVWPIAADSSTRYQGVSGFEGVAAGAAVDMDIALQADGSLLATRIAVEDNNDSDLTMWRGPLAFVDAQTPVLETVPVETQGALFDNASGSPTASAWQFVFGSSAFRISQQLANLKALPFSPVFESANMVPGQSTYLTTHAGAFPDGPNRVSAGTVTLLPQTLNGTIVGVSAEGGFTAYRVALATYDLFSALSQQAGQTTLLTAPTSLIVYTDSSTRQFNTAPLALGTVQRFRGLVFNDAGTLRMDCGWIFDGVAP